MYVVEGEGGHHKFIKYILYANHYKGRCGKLRHQLLPYRWPFQANPDPSTCLGVFGLSLYTTERDLREVFSRYGPLAGVNVVYDQRTGRSRGFAFVYFERLEDSKEVWKIFRVLFMDQMPSGLQTWCKQLIFIVILYFQVISFFLFYLLF